MPEIEHKSGQASDIFSKSVQSISNEIEQTLVLNGNFLETPWSLQNRYYILAALYENDPTTASRKFQRVLQNTEIALAKLEIIHHKLLERNRHLQFLSQQRSEGEGSPEVFISEPDCMAEPGTSRQMPYETNFTSCFCTSSGGLCIDHEMEGVLVLIKKEVLLTEVLDSYADALWSVASKDKNEDASNRFQKSIDAYSSALPSAALEGLVHKQDLRSAVTSERKTSAVLRGGGPPTPPVRPYSRPDNRSCMDYELTDFSPPTPPESVRSSSSQAFEMSIDDILDHLPRKSSINEVISVSPTEMGPQALISWKSSRTFFPKDIPVESAIKQSSPNAWSSAKALACEKDLIEYEIRFHNSFVLIPAGVSLARSELTGYKELEAALGTADTVGRSPAFCFARSGAPSPCPTSFPCGFPTILCGSRPIVCHWCTSDEKLGTAPNSGRLDAGQQDTAMEDISTTVPSAEEVSDMWALDCEDVRQWWNPGNVAKTTVPADGNKTVYSTLKIESPVIRSEEVNHVNCIVVPGPKQYLYGIKRGYKRAAPVDEEQLKQDLGFGGVCLLGKRRKMDSGLYMEGHRNVS